MAPCSLHSRADQEPADISSGSPALPVHPFNKMSGNAANIDMTGVVFFRKDIEPIGKPKEIYEREAYSADIIYRGMPVMAL